MTAYRVRTLCVGVLLALLALALLTSVARASSVDDAGKTTSNAGEVKLSAEQRARFVKGAKEAAGLNDDQVANALKDPRLLWATPVKVETKTSEEVVSSPSSQGAASGTFSKQAYAPICKKYTIIKRLVGLDNRLQLQFTAYKYWCFDGERVLSGSMTVQPWIRPDLRSGPNKAGYVYDKSTEKGADDFVTVDGLWHGGHKSTREGRFKWLVPGQFSPSQIIEVNAGRIGNYNGTCASAGPQYDTAANISPYITHVTPLRDTTGVPRGTDVEAFFSEAMDPKTINSNTFTLTRDGTTTPVLARVVYDAAQKKAVLYPSASLVSGATYTARIKGGPNGVKDAADLEYSYRVGYWSFTIQ